MEAIPVLLAVRMGRYLSGPGRMPVQDLVPAYLEVLEELSSFAVGRHTPESCASGCGEHPSIMSDLCCPGKILSAAIGLGSHMDSPDQG